ncbi:MAG: hypothetical protein NT040_10790 [Bacteroidetes bacterium]|nr:hypothetical protein [Bacteroidota bacterium]
MKKLTFVILAILGALPAMSQDKPSEPAKRGSRFYAGISYAYMKVDMKLSSLSNYSDWDGMNPETRDFTDDQVKEINSFIDRENQVNNLAVEFGMKLLDKPGSAWQITGTLMGGIAMTDLNVYNKNSESSELHLKSNFSKPNFGIGFNIVYNFNLHWGLSLNPFFMGTAGASNSFEDNINPDPVNFSVSRTDKYRTFYEHISLLARYRVGNFGFGAGPGFYWINSWHKYTIERTNNTTGLLRIDEATTKAIPRYFIDGTVSAEWQIIDLLTVYAHAGIGMDLVIMTGIHFNF